nr:FtsK/SpoIIIE domain-containing protein [Clostridium paraputrificum]
MNLDYKKVHDHFYALIGADVLGKPYLLDLSDSNSPHLLIAGQTGSGKSVLLSSILTSIMSFYTPEEVEMVLVDPKRVELTAFRKSPFTKIVATEVDEAIGLLQDLLKTMEERYKLFEKEEVKNINEYNEKNQDNKLKRVLMVFDEYASMMQADKEYVKIIESTIVRLSQEARAAGIHLIICTQSPKAEVITTTIRNNLNARIGLKVADAVASKVILDESGAETLLGKGDMLIKTADSSKLTRIKSPYVSNDELSSFIEYLNR